MAQTVEDLPAVLSCFIVPDDVHICFVFSSLLSHAPIKYLRALEGSVTFGLYLFMSIFSPT